MEILDFDQKLSMTNLAVRDNHWTQTLSQKSQNVVLWN